MDTMFGKSVSLLVVACFLAWSPSFADDRVPPMSGELAGLSYIETLMDGARVGAELPMVIALHYMGGSPATSIADYGDVDVQARLLSLAGPNAFNEGYSWFPDGYYDLDAIEQREITFDVADKVATFIRLATEAYPTRGRPILAGYSQGADLAHVIALRDPHLIAAALPMGGQFPDAWTEALDSDSALPREMLLFHGAVDEAVSVAESVAAMQYYTAHGVSTTLRTYAGVGHSYPAEMKRDYAATVRRLALAQR